MAPTSFQTVRLSAGRHRSPEEGACVVELCSMLAGEPFSDSPRSVCPVIAALLRPYNDLAGERRQELLGIASTVVGTRASAEIQQRRVDRCLAEVDELSAGGGRRRFLERVRAYPATPRRLRRLAADQPMPDDKLIPFGFGLVRLMAQHDGDCHDRLVALVLELAAMGTTGRPAPAPRPRRAANGLAGGPR